MPVYEDRCAIRSLAITAVGWTDIVGSALPINCNAVIVYNLSGVDVFFRTDPGNAQSQITLKNGEQFEVGSPLSIPGRDRFPAGCNPVGSLMSSSGNVNVIIESLN